MKATLAAGQGNNLLLSSLTRQWLNRRMAQDKKLARPCVNGG